VPLSSVLKRIVGDLNQLAYLPWGGQVAVVDGGGQVDAIGSWGNAHG
jgi:hypothetical protein